MRQRLASVMVLTIAASWAQASVRSRRPSPTTRSVSSRATLKQVASIGRLPHAPRDGGELSRRLGRRRPAVFLDYDETLTPIVDRPEQR